MMRFLFLISAIFSAGLVHAQNKGSSTSAPHLGLGQYLEQVKAGNLQAQGLVENIEALQLRLREPSAILMPEAFAQAGVFDDQRQTSNPTFTGTETRGNVWKLGVRKQTSFGLGANVYFNSQRVNVKDASAAFLPVPDYNESSAVVELSQSLWRNGFGAVTQAEIESKRAGIEMSLLEAKFNLKNLLLNAQNIYWSLVSYNQVVKLQEENVDRAKKLRDRMARGTKLRLFDDTDAMQAEASLQSRELELQTSLDDRAQLIREFNTLRGARVETAEQLDELPAQNWSNGLTEPKGKMSREDFEMLRAQARAAIATSKGAVSQIQPQLDVQASFAETGRDGRTARSTELATSDKYPNWSVNLVFSVPLDFGMVHDLKRAYRESGRAAEALTEHANYNEERTWASLLQQQREAHGRFKRALEIEKIQTELVSRERQRLLNGRTTTFEALNIEQGLALAQIQRVRAQLAFIQVHNTINTFEVQP